MSVETEEVDHYLVLGLPSGEEGSRLTLKEIEKAYRNQSRILHPDKRPNDPHANAEFQKLSDSINILRDEAARKVFDARLLSRRERILRESQRDSKRRKLAADLDERERAASAVDPNDLARRREVEVAAELKKEIAEFKARAAKKATPTSMSGQEKKEEKEGKSLDKEKILKVSWERVGGEYSAARLRELFERFGAVEDVVISSKGKKKGSAIVVMSSKDAAVAATHSMSGSLSNPLLVLPMQPPFSNASSMSSETVLPKSNIVGGFHDYEASIMEKLAKAQEKKKEMQ